MNVMTDLSLFLFIYLFIYNHPVPFKDYVAGVIFEDQCLNKERALLRLLRARSERAVDAAMLTTAKLALHQGSLAVGPAPRACSVPARSHEELGTISMDRHKQSHSAVNQKDSRIYYNAFRVQADTR